MILDTIKIHNQKDPVKIINFIRNKSFDPDSYGSLENYLKWLQNSLWKFEKIAITIDGESVEEKCRSMVKELIRHGLIELESRS